MRLSRFGYKYSKPTMGCYWHAMIGASSIICQLSRNPRSPIRASRPTRPQLTDLIADKGYTLTMRAIFHWSSIVCLLVLLTPSAQAELRPKWEYGLGLAVLELPDYPGSDESATYLAPYPYIEYHGTSVRISREGIQRQLLVRDRLKLDFRICSFIFFSFSLWTLAAWYFKYYVFVY